MKVCMKSRPDEKCLIAEVGSEESGVFEEVDGVEVRWTGERGPREFGQTKASPSGIGISRGIQYLGKQVTGKCGAAEIDVLAVGEGSQVLKPVLLREMSQAESGWESAAGASRLIRLAVVTGVTAGRSNHTVQDTQVVRSVALALRSSAVVHSGTATL